MFLWKNLLLQKMGHLNREKSLALFTRNKQRQGFFFFSFHYYLFYSVIVAHLVWPLARQSKSVVGELLHADRSVFLHRRHSNNFHCHLGE